MAFRSALAALTAALVAVLLLGPAQAQSILQSGPTISGHLPMYQLGPGQGFAAVVDSGFASGLSAAGTPTGTGINDLLQVNHIPGTGPFGSHVSLLDAPVSGPYHFLSLDSNPGGAGALLSVGAANGATPLPLTCNVNGTVISNCLEAGAGNVIGPNPSTIGDVAVWANATGTLLQSGNPTMLNMVGSPGILVNVPAYNSIAPTYSMINADPINASSSPLTQSVLNIGMYDSTGQGHSIPQGVRLGLTVGAQGLAGSGDLWAENLATYLTPTYNSTNAIAEVSEMDIVKDPNAGAVDPRPGPVGMQFPISPRPVVKVAPNVPTLTSSNVLNFAPGVLPTDFTLAQGATLRDLTTPSAIPYDTYVTSFTTTSITMSANPAVTVNAGDQIAITILYTYGLVMESCCNVQGKSTAEIVMSGAAPAYRGAGCDGSTFIEGCFFDYSIGPGASYSMWGQHAVGIDMTNAVFTSGHAIVLPGGTAASGYIGEGTWSLSSIGGDSSLEIKSLGGVAPDWLLQTVVSSGTAGRLRIEDMADSLEIFALTKGNPSSGGTAMSLLINNTEGVGLYPVTLGAPDGCGTGFRCLRVPN